MKQTIKILTAAVALACAMPLAADNHEEEDGYNLAIHHIKAKLSHVQQFQAGLEALSACMAENGSEDSYSVWRAFNGDRTQFHIVDQFDTWTDFDQDDEAGDTCWGTAEIYAGVFDNMASWETSYAEKLPAWSGNAEDYTVVHLHNFRVEEGDDFRALVGEMMGYMKDAEYAHQPDWFDVMPGGYWEADFFAVSHFANVAAMDEERLGVTGVLREALGEERADQMWEDWGDTLAEMRGYWRETLVLQPSMGYSPSDD